MNLKNINKRRNTTKANRGLKAPVYYPNNQCIIYLSITKWNAALSELL